MSRVVGGIALLVARVVRDNARDRHRCLGW